jgi:hypothetical protein
MIQGQTASADSGDASSWIPTRRALWSTVAITACITAVVVWTLGSTGQFFLVALIVPCFLFFGLLLVLAWPARVILFRQNPRETKLGLSGAHCVLFLTAFGIQVVGFIGGIKLDDYRSRVAREWCESLAPALEDWRASHGEYPKELAQLGIELDPPRYCQKGLIYLAREGGYFLYFPDEGLLSGWAYSSERGDWSHYD